ncbi:MAG TPA: AI-2E family transporter [Tepidisphaeraceae bacterium]|jgi:AI-2 transport protein TqsA|nr:AI-2E family transporter [Tepidisphaeraceae bacterium]
MAAKPLESPPLPPATIEPEFVRTPETEVNDLVGRSEQAEADRRVQTVCLLILAFVATGFGLFQLQPVLVPFVLALFFAACLKPVIEFQMRYLGMPRPLAVAGAILLAAAVVTLIGIPLTSSVQQMWPKFDFEFGKFVDRAKQSSLVERLGLNNLLPKDASSWTASLSAAFVQASSIASKTFLVIVFTLFILLGRRGPIRRTTGVLSEIEVRVQLYISQMVLLSAIAGILVWIVLWILGVEMAALFGVLAFLLNFIPTIGSIIATLLPLPVILIDPHMGVPAKICAVAIPGAIQIILGNAVQPRFLGNALDLHPIVVLISLVFWSMIWGLAGAFLATPMTAVLRIVLEKIPATRPVAELLAGRIDAVF